MIVTVITLALMITNAYAGGFYYGPCSEEEEWTNFPTDWRDEEYGGRWYMQYYYKHTDGLEIICSTVNRDPADPQTFFTNMKFAGGIILTYTAKTYEVQDHSISDEPLLLTEHIDTELGRIENYHHISYGRPYILTKHIMGIWHCLPDQEFKNSVYGKELANLKDKPDARYIYVREQDILYDVKEVNPLVFEMTREHKPTNIPTGYHADTFEGELVKVTSLKNCKE